MAEELTEPQAPDFDLGGSLRCVGEWYLTRHPLTDGECRAVIVPWLAVLQNHVEGPLAEAIAELGTLPDGAAEALKLAGYAAPNGD